MTMKCPDCGYEMKHGYVKARKVASIMSYDVSLMWYSDEDKGKLFKLNCEELEHKGKGYYCEHCKKAFACFKKSE